MHHMYVKCVLLVLWVCIVHPRGFQCHHQGVRGRPSYSVGPKKVHHLVLSVFFIFVLFFFYASRMHDLEFMRILGKKKLALISSHSQIVSLMPVWLSHHVWMERKNNLPESSTLLTITYLQFSFVF